MDVSYRKLIKKKVIETDSSGLYPRFDLVSLGRGRLDLSVLQSSLSCSALTSGFLFPFWLTD